ncbi:MAG: hypothetical protein GY801_53265 [bacterium]|nr:hypothetical protein [bacterium]
MRKINNRIFFFSFPIGIAACVFSGMNLDPLSSWRVIFDGRYKYVWRQGETPLLFELKDNPQ